MARVRPKQKKFPFVKYAILGGIAALVAYAVIMGVSGIQSAGAKNFSFEIKNSSTGPQFISVGSSGKKSIATGHNSPTLEVNMGDTVAIHVENLDSTENHDFVIPDLNVHSKALGYFQADTVTFVADKKGEFTYTSSTHPEMKGQIVVQ